jgi:DNA-binding response OmpR family regulator
MARILLIDDDPDVRTVMSMMLKNHNYEVDTASSKEEAFNKLNSEPPSVILMDVLLSGADGREICREIKSTDDLKGIPIIMFSAHPSAADKIDSYGADDFLSKPLNTDSLLEKLNHYTQ